MSSMDRIMMSITPSNTPLITLDELVVSEGYARYGSDEPFLCFVSGYESAHYLTIDEARQLKSKIEEWLWNVQWEAIKKMHVG